MRYVIILLFCWLICRLPAQAPVSQIEGYLEVYHSIDTTSLYLGRDVARNTNNSLNRSNTFVGTEAGNKNISGHSNAFFGRNAGFFNETGQRNTYLGMSAGSRNKGSDNVLIGYTTGLNTLEGDANTFIGHRAGYFLASSNNIVLGNDAGPPALTLSSDRLYIDVEQSTTPLIYGEFNNDLIRIHGTLQLGATNYFNGDDGLLKGPTNNSGDIFLVANDAIILEVGDNASESGNFEVWNNSEGDKLLTLDADGDLWIKGTLTQGSTSNARQNLEHHHSNAMGDKAMVQGLFKKIDILMALLEDQAELIRELEKKDQMLEERLKGLEKSRSTDP